MTSIDLPDPVVQRNETAAIDRRLTVLETRFDTIITMMPNKADLSDVKAELKADIHGEAARLTKWAAATATTMVIGFGGMILTLARLHAV